MFFRDAIFRNKRNEEPWWFSTLRRTIALSLIFLLLIYGLSRLKDVAAFLNSPNILIVEHKNVANFPGKNLFFFLYKFQKFQKFNQLS